MSRATAAMILVATVCVSPGCGQSDDSLIVSSLQRFIASLAGDAATSSDAEPGSAGAEATSSAQQGGAGPQGSAGERESVLIEGGEFSSLEEGQAEPAEVPIYRYTDANGVVRMVRGLHGVPERYRGSAQSLSKASMPVINRYETKEVATRRVIAYTPSYNPNRSDVLLYSAEWCGACRKAKAFLDKEGVAYELLDIDRDPQAKAEVRRILGSVRIPLLDIDGTYVAGFAPGEIRRALRKAG